MSDATDNRFYREPAAPVVVGDLRERVIDKALDVLADAAVATQDEGSERLADTMLAVVQPELERLSKLAEANDGQARFWADHFAEIERANRDALGAHHKPGHSVAELITALIGELAEVREFGNDAMNSTHTKAQEIAKWVEGYGKLSADNKRLTRERDEAREHLDKVRRGLRTPEGWATKIHAVYVRQQRDKALALLGAIWLYVPWRSITRHLTTEQRELWADAVEVAGDPGSTITADRWWRDDAPVSGSDTTEDGGDRG